MTKRELIKKVDEFIKEINELKDSNHGDPKFKDYKVRTQKFLEELAIMEMSRELIHFKKITFFHPVMRTQLGPSSKDITQYKKGLDDLELLLTRVKDDIVNFNDNGSSYSKNLGFKLKER